MTRCSVAPLKSCLLSNLGLECLTEINGTRSLPPKDVCLESFAFSCDAPGGVRCLGVGGKYLDECMVMVIDAD